jgi:hypothetical protein
LASPSAGQGADLGQVVGEDAVPAPDRGSVPAVQAGAVPAVSALEVADPPFGAGAPFDQPVETAAVLKCLAGRGGRGLAGNGNRAHAEFVQVAFDSGLAVAAVCGNRARDAAGAAADPPDRWCQLRPVGSGTVLNVVVQDDAVVVVGDLGFVPELRLGGRCGPCGSAGHQDRAG